MMANQTTASILLAFLNEAEKTRLQELFQRMNTNQGHITFDAFWRQLRDCLMMMGHWRPRRLLIMASCNGCIRETCGEI